MLPSAVLLASLALARVAFDDLGFESAPGMHGGYIDILERNSHIIYPLLAIGVVGLLVAGILQAWRSQDLDGLAKVELKREIILELRKQMGGVSAEMLARAVNLEPLKTVKLLEEMQRDGILASHTNSARLTLWRLKGVPNINVASR